MTNITSYDCTCVFEAFASTPGPAPLLLSALAHVVAERLTPTARGEATAATLQKIAAMPEVAPLSLKATELRDALLSLVVVRSEADEPSVLSRRRTCQEMADCMPGWLGMREAAPGAEALWRAVGEHFPVDPSAPGRGQAVRATWSREAGELVTRRPRGRTSALLTLTDEVSRTRARSTS